VKKNGYLAIKMLSKLLKECCSPPEDHESLKSLSDVTAFLETKHSLLDIILTNFAEYMARVSAEVKSGRIKDVDKLEARVIQDTFMHSDQITERLEFIRFYTRSS
jgi:hypothetical protein